MTRPLTDTQLAATQAHLEQHGTLAGLTLPPAPTRKPRNNEESRTQRALIRWWQANCRHFGVPEILLFSVPNGFNGDARRGSVMKLEGQRKGCPDLILATHSGPRPSVNATWSKSLDLDDVRYPALFLELKTAKGHLSPEQEVFHQRLTEQGYKVVVCRSLVECVNQITTYLK